MTWSTSVPAVVTLHDLWPFVSPAADVRKRAREQSHYRSAAELASRFIAVSNHTAGEAERYLGIDPARIDVVPHGVDTLVDGPPTPARFDGVQRYVLCVGEAEPRKDLPTLIEAMDRLPDRLRATTALVLAGRMKRSTLGAVDHWSGRPRERSTFVVTGEVSDTRLASLYAGAAAFAFPSRYEGFGLPVLEAMRYGAPVIASDAAAISEAAGDAALFFPVGDASALAHALERVLDDEAFARKLAAAGRNRAAQMTLETCARKTIEVFELVAA